jgi:hypothetical protein
MPAAGIEEVIPFVRLNEGRKSMLSQTNPAAYCVFADDGYFHKIPPDKMKKTSQLES